MTRWKSLVVLILGMPLGVFAVGCDRPPGAGSSGDGTQHGAEVGTIEVALVAPASDGIAAVRIDVSAGGMVVDSKTVPASSADAGSGFPLADAFFVLPPGTYLVVATPLTANGAPLQTCPSTSTNANVSSGMTTEVNLSLACSGPAKGGLDVVVTTTDPPVITDLSIDPSKFTSTCAPVTFTVTATDPRGEALMYAWTIVSSPAPTGAHQPVTQLVPNGDSATFFTDLAGDYTLQVSVTNTDSRVATLSFPVHVIAGSTAQCNPLFDTLNPWSAAGPAVQDLTYGNRVHVFPVPGTPLPDPICHLTAHGGPFLPSPVVRPVLWGSSVRASFSSPMISLYTSLFTNPQFSSYLEALVQYTGMPTSGSVAAPVTIPPLNLSTTLSETDIQEEIGKQIRVGVLPAPTGNDLYTVILPSSVSGTLSGGGSSCMAGGFCAYHGSFQFAGVDATYAVMPDCGAGACAVAGSHELIEAMTDPLIGFVGTGPGDNLAWYDDESEPCNGEIADLCEGNDYTLGGFSVAAAWSDELGLCETVALNPPACGAVGTACCAGNVCNDTNSGCDNTTMCVTCPAPAPTPTLVAQEEDTSGSNCFSDSDSSPQFGPGSCGTGLTRAFIKTTSISVSAVASRIVWKKEMAHSSGCLTTRSAPCRAVTGRTRHGEDYQASEARG